MLRWVLHAKCPCILFNKTAKKTVQMPLFLPFHYKKYSFDYHFDSKKGLPLYHLDFLYANKSTRQLKGHLFTLPAHIFVINR